jgi:hypothetical protein
MRVIVGLILLMVFAGGCKRPAGSTQQIKRDSVIVMEREKIVEIPGERVELLIPIECDSITLKPKPVKSYSRTSDTGTVSISIDSSGIRFFEERKALQDRIRELEERKVKVETVREEIPVPYTRKIDIICRWLAAILLAWQLFKIIVLKRL